MKYYSRKDIYKNSTGSLTFDPITKTGRSYNWYLITLEIDGVLFVNTYAYSATTGKHVRKIMDLLDSLGMEYIKVEAPEGLQAPIIAMNHMNEHIKAHKDKLTRARVDHSKRYHRCRIVSLHKGFISLRNAIYNER